MKNTLMLAAALACLPGRTLAQANVWDPAAPAPAVVYRSAFEHVPTGVEMQSVDWAAANAEVGQFRNGHIDILKWEEAQARKNPNAPAPMRHTQPGATANTALPAPSAAGAVKP